MFHSGTFRRFISDTHGATSIEYALIASSIGGVLAVTVWCLGGDIKTAFYEKLLAMM